MTAAGGLLQRALAAWNGHFETPSGLEAELAKPEYENAPIDPERLAAVVIPELERLRRGLSDLSARTESRSQHLARLLGWTERVNDYETFSGLV
jgi:hypothetical protein